MSTIFSFPARGSISSNDVSPVSIPGSTGSPHGGGPGVVGMGVRHASPAPPGYNGSKRSPNASEGKLPIFVFWLELVVESLNS